jgi:uncharacterized protein (TIGR00159 family)
VGEIRLADALDVALVALLLWAAFSWLRRARSRIALAGAGIAMAVYWLARQLQLQMTVWILQGFFAALVLILVVVFQEDLRRLFEQLAAWGLRRKARPAPPDAVDALVRAVARLARERTGGLLVLPGREPLERHVEGGIALGGRLSEALLLSLCDPHSPGHDGAILVEGDRVARFAVHLPLSTDQAQLGPGGTRHAAGLGIAERTDALAVVISEERGTVSVARDGRLRLLSGPESLGPVVRRFLGDRGLEARTPPPRLRAMAERWPEALLAVVASAGLWLLFVPGEAVGQFVRRVPVTVGSLPEGYALESVSPGEVEVLFEGRRRDLYLAGTQGRLEVRVEPDARLIHLGRRGFRLGPHEVRHPPSLRALDVRPPEVRLNLEREG